MFTYYISFRVEHRSPASAQSDVRLLELGPTGTFSLQGWVLMHQRPLSPAGGSLLLLSSICGEEPTCSWRVHEIWPVESPQSAIHKIIFTKPWVRLSY